MGIDRETAETAQAGRTDHRRRLALLALAMGVSWASMLFHNLSELPLTPLDLENTGPLAVDIVLFLACWRWPVSRVAWAFVLGWALLNMVVGGILTVLPLPVLPFVPEQTVDHYAVHLVYTLGQVPLVLLAFSMLRRLRQQKPRAGAEGGCHD